MDRLEESSDYCAKLLELVDEKRIPPHDSDIVHQMMAKIAMRRKQPAEQLRQSWLFMEKTDALWTGGFCKVYTVILRSLFPIVGREVLSFISYICKSTDPPQ